jgi:hypothetical protein
MHAVRVPKNACHPSDLAYASDSFCLFRHIVSYLLTKVSIGILTF